MIPKIVSAKVAINLGLIN